MVKRTQQSPNEEPYDIIFLDLDMPIMDGYDCCVKITQFYEYVN